MPSHVEELGKAITKALDEQKKLLKEWKAEKDPGKKDKLKKMAEAALKIAQAHAGQVESAKAKDVAEMKQAIHDINPGL